MQAAAVCSSAAVAGSSASQQRRHGFSAALRGAQLQQAAGRGARRTASSALKVEARDFPKPEFEVSTPVDNVATRLPAQLPAAICRCRLAPPDRGRTSPAPASLPPMHQVEKTFLEMQAISDAIKAAPRPKNPLTVVIAGAGLAGLSTAKCVPHA